MNILQIGTIDKGGGAANISWALKNGLEKRGHTTSMFVADKNSKDPNVFTIPRTVHRYVSYIISDDTSLFNTDWILETEQFKKADVIHCHNLHGFYFNLETLQKMAVLKPIVWTLHDMWAITPHCAHAFNGELCDGFFNCPSRDIYPRIIFPREEHLRKRKSDIYKRTPMTIVTPSKWLAKKVQQSVLENKDLQIIQNGIPLSSFSIPSETNEILLPNLPPHKKIILVLAPGGKSDRWKGWQHSYEVMKRYSTQHDVHFLYIGVNYKEIAQMPNVTIHPPINTKKELARYYALADLFLYPSLADNCPLVVQEAMACGTPVLSFNTGGIPELIDHEKNGYVVEYGNTNALVKTLNTFLSLSKEKRESISDSAIEKAKTYFDEEKMVEKYIQLYTSLI